MSGEIQFESEPGKGSVFHFEIPLMKQKKGSQMSFSMPVEMMEQDYLIIENDVELRNRLKSYLLEWGCTQVVALNSNEFTASYLNEGNNLRLPAVVLASVRINGENGGPLIVSILERHRKWRGSLIGMCMYGEESEWKEKLGPSVSSMLSIPIRQEALVNRLVEVQQKSMSFGLGKAQTVPSLESRSDENPNLRILVAEDNKVNQKVITRLLAKMGCTAICVENGLIALETLCEDSDFDMVIMDYQMPVMNGFVAAENIRKLDSEVSRIPIIALTANAVQFGRDEALACGMNDYLHKPVRFEDLKKAILKEMHSSLNQDEVTVGA